MEGNSRDSTTTGSLSISGQTYTLTAENVCTSSLTTDAHMFVLLTRSEQQAHGADDVAVRAIAEILPK